MTLHRCALAAVAVINAVAAAAILTPDVGLLLGCVLGVLVVAATIAAVELLDYIGGRL